MSGMSPLHEESIKYGGVWSVDDNVDCAQNIKTFWTFDAEGALPALPYMFAACSRDDN